MDKNSVEKSNSFKLLVLDEISRDPQFFKRDNLIRYTIPSESQNLTPEDITGKVTAVLDLRNEGAFEIENWEQESGELKFICYLKILRPGFGEICTKYGLSDKAHQGRTEKDLKWRDFHLNIETGKALISKRPYQFQTEKPPFKIFKALIEKRISGRGDGEVTFDGFANITGINDKEIIKSKIRELRRALGINRNKNPLEDVFQETGNGYRLILPESFS